MKKCLHLRKTKPHWRRKPPVILSYREKGKFLLERKLLHTFSANMALLGAFNGPSPLRRGVMPLP
jgi:hypothetical protein